MDLRTLLLVLVIARGAGSVLAADATIPAATPPAPSAIDPLDDIETLGYQPLGVVSGTLRLAGSSTLHQAAALWADGFQAIHPDTTLPIDSGGSAAGWQALTAGKADVALVSRPITAAEREAFEAAAPARRLVVVPVAFQRLTWIVQAANPIGEIPWSPDAGVVSATATDTAVTWSRLGADGEQAAVPLRVHATELGSGTRWHLDRLLSGTATLPLDIREHTTIKDLATAVAADRGSLGLIGRNDGDWPDVRRLPLAIPADAAPTADAVPGSARTPDCRPLFMAIALPREADWPPLLRELVAYVLSWEGQLDVVQDGLEPLARAEILAQREILGGPVER